jgi:hypothetical protein
MPFWIPISKGGIDFMKQKERFDEKPKQEHTEPVHHRKAMVLRERILSGLHLPA